MAMVVTPALRISALGVPWSAGRLLDREAGEKKQVHRAQGMLEVFLSISLVVGIYNFSLCRPVKRC